MENLKVKVKKLNDLATFSKGTNDSVGFDLTCTSLAVHESATPGGLELIYLNLGVIVEPPTGAYFDLVPRSSFSKYGLIQANSIGIIDPDYRDEWKLAVKPFVGSWYDFYTYEKFLQILKAEVVGKRVAQAILRPLPRVEILFTDELSETERLGGFGSSGE